MPEVRVTVKSKGGGEGRAEFELDETIKRDEVLRRAGMEVGVGLEEVVLEDERGGAGRVVVEEEVKGLEETVRLTGRTSLWHVQPTAESGGGGNSNSQSSAVSAGSTEAGNTQQVQSSGGRGRKRELNEELKRLEEQLNDPYNIRDIDELQEEIKKVKKEIGWGLW